MRKHGIYFISVMNFFGQGTLTTMKSLLAPMTRTSNVPFAAEGTGSDELSFLKSNCGNFELTFIRPWYLQGIVDVNAITRKEKLGPQNGICKLENQQWNERCCNQ
jgi:hypothetical protein